MFRTKMQRIKTEREREREREREKKDTKQLYKFLPQTGSSHVPLALPRRVHSNVISDYKCSLLKLARDFKLLKHNCKRFLMLLNTIKRLLISSTTARDFYSNRITKKIV